MRIIGGDFKGRRFYPPADKWPTRPTTDFAKEALFNILQNRFDFSTLEFLDLFGGTGSHCFEMISRGCRNATYVDNFVPCVRFVQKLARELKVDQYLTIRRADVFRFCHQSAGSYDYIFAGPPYALPNITEIPDMIFGGNLLRTKGLFILEHNRVISLTDHPNFLEIRKYGQCHFTLFKNADELT